MSAILRFDDFSVNSNLVRWNHLLQLLNSYNIKAIIGVIPNNQDETLNFNLNDKSDFWSLVHSFYTSGHLIAIHGYTHVCDSDERGDFCKGAIGGEFLGNYLEQYTRLNLALRCFIDNNIGFHGFMAPRHNFNKTTLIVVKEIGLSYIFDRYFPGNRFHNGINYIVNHYSSIRKYKLGFFRSSSIAFHIDFLSDSKFKDILFDISENNTIFYKKHDLINFKKCNFFDFVIDFFYRYYIFLKHIINNIFRRISF